MINSSGEGTSNTFTWFKSQDAKNHLKNSLHFHPILLYSHGSSYELGVVLTPLEQYKMEQTVVYILPSALFMHEGFSF